MAAPDRMGQPSNPRPTSPNHRSCAMNVSRDQADGEALAEVLNWAHRTLRQIERVESNFAASQTDRRYRTGTSKQADADLYRDEAIDTTLLLVTAQSPRNCTQPLQHIKARSSQVSDRRAEPRSNVCVTYTSTRIATTTHSSAAVRPAGSTRGCFRSCLALTPGCFIGTTRRD